MIRKLYFAYALRGFLCSLFFHAKGGYGGVDKHYVMGIESEIQQLILIYVFEGPSIKVAERVILDYQ